jgi:hypothetical protein
VPHTYLPFSSGLKTLKNKNDKKNLWGWNLLRCKERGKSYRNFSWHFKSFISDQLTFGTKGNVHRKADSYFAVVLFGVLPPLPSSGEDRRHKGKKEQERAKIASHTDH